MKTEARVRAEQGVRATFLVSVLGCGMTKTGAQDLIGMQGCERISRIREELGLWKPGKGACLSAVGSQSSRAGHEIALLEIRSVRLAIHGTIEPARRRRRPNASRTHRHCLSCRQRDSKDEAAEYLHPRRRHAADASKGFSDHSDPFPQFILLASVYETRRKLSIRLYLISAKERMLRTSWQSLRYSEPQAL
jgi:hypothetical protein